MSIIDLSPFELEIVKDAEIMLAKNRIIKKVTEMFALLANDFDTIAAASVNENYFAIPPKISKGEQYIGLPYVMLDYPRNFLKNDTLAIRCMFWWGNHFSIHLQISGYYKSMFQNNMAIAIKNGKLNGWFLGIHESEWHHHFKEDNYVPVSEKATYNLNEKRFIKIAQKIPLDEWNEVPEILTSRFKFLLNLISI